MPSNACVSFVLDGAYEALNAYENTNLRTYGTIPELLAALHHLADSFGDDWNQTLQKAARIYLENLEVQ